MRLHLRHSVEGFRCADTFVMQLTDSDALSFTTACGRSYIRKSFSNGHHFEDPSLALQGFQSRQHVESFLNYLHYLDLSSCHGLLVPHCHSLISTLSQFLHQDAMRLERRLNVKQVIHALERNALCLWDQEESTAH